MARYCDFSKQTLISATPDNPRHSEASVIELKNGSLLMAWQNHKKSIYGSGDEAPSDISLMNSNDNGATWQRERVVAEMTDGCVNVYCPSFMRNADGSLALYFVRYMELVIGEKELTSFYKITSYDEGETWSDEEIIWERQPKATLNHAARRISDGALLLPIIEIFDSPKKDGFYRVSVLRSEDDMKSYTQSNLITVPRRGLMEPCIAEMRDGTLNMVLRTQLGSVFFSESRDGGRTWSKPQTTGLRSPESCPFILSIPNSDAQLVIWNNSEYDMFWKSHYGKRTPLTMAISRDGLKTFSDFFDIETDPDRAFTNPSVTLTSSGLYILNYWSCEYTDEGLFGPLIDLKLASFRIDLEE